MGGGKGKGNNNGGGKAGRGGGGGGSAAKARQAADDAVQARLAAGPQGGGRRGERKMMAQAEQAANVARKASFEDDLFWQASRRNAGKGGRPMPSKGEEDALFARQGSAGIDFDKYQDIKVECSGKGSQDNPPLEDFEHMFAVVPPFLASNIAKCGYRVPTPVQRFAVPHGIAGRDIMACAQTGSGKTAGFLLPSISALAGAPNPPQGGAAMPRILVLAPTRELCSQIHGEACKLLNRSPYYPMQV